MCVCVRCVCVWVENAAVHWLCLSQHLQNCITGATRRKFLCHTSHSVTDSFTPFSIPSLSNNAPLKRFTFPRPASVVMQFYFISLKANFSLRILLLYFALLPAFLAFFSKKYPVKLSQRCAVIEELRFQSGSCIPSEIYRVLHINLGRILLDWTKIDYCLDFFRSFNFNFHFLPMREYSVSSASFPPHFLWLSFRIWSVFYAWFAERQICLKSHA